MNLLFKGGPEYLILDIGRKEKKLVVSSSITSYKPVATKWKMLFDKGKETAQERITDKLDDYHFKLAIVASMNQQGYQLIKEK